MKKFIKSPLNFTCVEDFAGEWENKGAEHNLLSSELTDKSITELKPQNKNIKSLGLFGSTGSIGLNSLEIIKRNPEKFKLNALVAYSNVELLAKQALEFRPKYVCIADQTKLIQLNNLLQGSNIKILAGEEGMLELAKLKLDLVIMAIVGAAAILPTINAIKSGSNIALANKECLVCAGHLITSLAKKHQVRIIPIDSEHSGLFQIFDHNRPHLIKDITLTASGGPFREYTLEQMSCVTKAQALKHPNWSMGAKITVDSASLVNKCLEVIEAYHLFPLKTDQIKIVIHPESIIHALVNYQDGSVLAQLSIANMQIAISYALHYPERAFLDEFNHFDLANIGKLHFYPPDHNKFKSLSLLNSVLGAIDSNAPLIFNVANEVAVAAFLNDQIKFCHIIQVIEEMLNQIDIINLNELDEIIHHIELVKKKSLAYINRINQ
jgi:1-deoxy-D-xylulose-5-phosphate reductoisomerase